MNKKTLLFATTIFFFTYSHTWAGQDLSESTLLPANNFQQVHNQNKYIIEQLEMLARAKGTRPNRMGAQLTKVDIPLLTLKLRSLNYLIQKELRPETSSFFPRFKENLKFNNQELMQQSQIMLQNLPRLFEKNQLTIPVAFDKSPTSSWFKLTITPEKLHYQLLQIEGFLYGLRNIIEPGNVYEIVLSTRLLISNGCQSLYDITPVPLVMGKRPKDVYSHLLEYLKILSSHDMIAFPSKGPVHVLPHDVFDVAIMAMAYSRNLQNKVNFKKVVDELAIHEFLEQQKKPDIVTPSHVYQAVAQNIEILECVSHAS